MKKVAIVYHYFAHYRQPIIEELAKSKENEYYFVSGEETDIDIKIIDFVHNGELANRRVLLENVWFTKRFLWQKGLIKILLSSNFDTYIFLGSSYHITTWLAVLIARIRNKKSYFWMHGFYKENFSIGDYFKLFLFYRLPNGYFLYGNRSYERLKEIGVKESTSMHIVYNSLDYSKSKSLRKSLSEQEFLKFRNEYFDDISLPIVVFIGRLNNVKKIDMLIEAQHIISERNKKSSFNLLLIGDGEEITKLKELANNYSVLDINVKFIGAVYDENLNAKLLMHSDLCVTPGEVGLTAIHSMSYGTPVISHNNFDIQMPEVEVIIPSTTGNFYEYGNLISLADTIEAWIRGNPMKRPVVRDACFEVVDSKYNPNYQVKVFDNVICNR